MRGGVLAGELVYDGTGRQGDSGKHPQEPLILVVNASDLVVVESEVFPARPSSAVKDEVVLNETPTGKRVRVWKNVKNYLSRRIDF